jgi:hypothetical protein
MILEDEEVRWDAVADLRGGVSKRPNLGNV